MKQKLLILFASLFLISPVCADEQKNGVQPYIVDLYTAVKNNTGWRSYFIWFSTAERDAISQGEAAGESAASLYWQAAEYAYDHDDPKVAGVLKKNYAIKYTLTLPLLALVVGIGAGAKLLHNKFKYISSLRRANDRTEAEITDLQNRIEGYQIFNFELYNIGEPALPPRGLADRRDIEDAYRRLQLHWHPDRIQRLLVAAHESEEEIQARVAEATLKTREIVRAREILIGNGSRPSAPGAE